MSAGYLTQKNKNIIKNKKIYTVHGLKNKESIPKLLYLVWSPLCSIMYGHERVNDSMGLETILITDR